MFNNIMCVSVDVHCTCKLTSITKGEMDRPVSIDGRGEGVCALAGIPVTGAQGAE